MYTANGNGADQIAPLRKLICACIVRVWHKRVCRMPSITNDIGNDKSLFLDLTHGLGNDSFSISHTAKVTILSRSHTWLR